jgi:hypothetical protein
MYMYLYLYNIIYLIHIIYSKGRVKHCALLCGAVGSRIISKSTRSTFVRSGNINWDAHLRGIGLNQGSEGGHSPNLNIVLRSVSTHVSKSCLSSKMFAKHRLSLDLMNTIFLRINLLLRPRYYRGKSTP